MMMLNRKGFTLVEIMIVVAIIALLAAIAIPNLLRARLNANETAAISTCQTLSTALQSFYAANPTGTAALPGGFPLNLLALAPAGQPPYVDLTLAVATDPTRQGYQFFYTPVPPPGTTTVRQQYHVYAQPVNFQTTGIREFYIDEGGVVYATLATSAALQNDPGHAIAANQGDPDGLAGLVWQAIQ